MLVDLVLLNKASTLNVNIEGSLEVAQIYLPGWGGVGLTVIKRLISVLNWTFTELLTGTELGKKKNDKDRGKQ